MPRNPEISKPRYDEMREQFSAPPENYNTINENQIVGSRRQVWDGDYTRERHLGDTDRMIGILDGSIKSRKIIDPTEKEKSLEKPDVVIALDKSARPAVEMMDAFWEQLAQEGAEQPEFDFLNIDRMDWLPKMGYSASDAESSAKKNIDIEKISPVEIARIRAYFTEGELSEDNWQDEVWKLPTRLDGKNVMVLDEVENSGATLRLARELIKKAVPEAVVTGDVFWTELTHKVVGGNPQWATAPVWYDRSTVAGRGIGDIAPAYYDHKYDQDPNQENLRRKIAGFVLSAPFHNPKTFEEMTDPEWLKLKQDIAYMTYDYADGKILRMPDADRDDGWEEAIEAQGVSVPDYVGYINKRARTIWATRCID